MTERKFSEKLMVAARKKFRGCVVLKHADRFTSAIPDLQICWLNTASWIETKFLRNGDSYKDILRMDQLVMAHQLGAVSGGRSWIVIFNEAMLRTEVWLPGPLSSHVWPKVVGERPVDPHLLAALEIDLLKLNLQNMLIERGCLMVEGYNVDLPMRLVLDGISRAK